MNTLVIYDSEFGNTERVAQAIASGLRAASYVQATPIRSFDPSQLENIDVLILGCPTQAWRPTQAIQSLLTRLPAERLDKMAVACFDTRFNKPRWLTGSAARRMGQLLRAMGVTLLVPPESFFVIGKEGPLVDGELNRATAWARELAQIATPAEVALA